MRDRAGLDSKQHRPFWRLTGGGGLAPPDNDMKEMTVREFKLRLDAIGDDELCCGTFWLADDFLSIDPTLTQDEVASAMEIAQDSHDASEGFNWRHIEWAIGEMKQGGDA